MRWPRGSDLLKYAMLQVLRLGLKFWVLPTIANRYMIIADCNNDPG